MEAADGCWARAYQSYHILIIIIYFFPSFLLSLVSGVLLLLLLLLVCSKKRSMSSGSTSAGGGGGGGGDRVSDPSSASSSRAIARPTVAEAVWPQHFVEAVAVRVAVDAAQTRGRLAAAPAIAIVFQVCSTWRCVSESELLWEEITRRVWSRCHCLLASWRDEFRRLHRTGLNFRTHRCTHTHILPPPYGYLISCRRLALSDSHLAAGFSDGTVRLFHLPTGRHLASFGPDPQQGRLGLYSLSVSGLLILSSNGDQQQQQQQQQRLVIAFQNGDVNIASPVEPPAGVRRVNVGTPVEDGPLVDFTGSSNSRWWVGLFAGVPGRSWHVWDGETEQLVYVGGSLTDPDSVMGWRMLTDLRGPAIGRVRMPEPGIAVGCTASRIQVVDLDGGGGGGGDEGGDRGSVVRYVEVRRGGVIVEAVDGCDGRVMVVDQMRRIAKVRTGQTLEEVCRFGTATARRRSRREEEEEGGVAGCMNWGYAVLVCSSSGEAAGGGVIRVWDAMSGEYLYRLRERIGGGGGGGGNASGTSVIAASDRYVSAWSEDTGLHAWDFGVDAAVP